MGVRGGEGTGGAGRGGVKTVLTITVLARLAACVEEKVHFEGGKGLI